MNNALECYLNDFYNDPNNIEEYKIIFLKNNYYSKINVILNSEYKNFKIGIKKKDKNVLYFIDKNKLNNEVIYNINNEEFFINNKVANTLEKIDYNSYIIKNKRESCLNKQICNIL
tara:strand:+ start:79 stop:426 length:348 start_codon:yes stop_codon:yes gene_type:complete